MRADVIELTVDRDTGEGIYSFVCPACDDLVEKPADKKIVSLLRSVGVEFAEHEGEHEAPLEEKPDGPAFTLDDVIDFHFLLATDDWLERLTASVR